MTTMTKYGIFRAGDVLKSLVLALAALFAIDASAQAGYLHVLSGSATFKKGAARPVAARIRDTFVAGTTVVTGDDGYAVLKFADGQVVVLGPDSALNLEQYRFDAQNVKASGMAIDLEVGTMRLVGGVIASQNRQAMRISAGESDVSIVRAGGVDFSVTVRDSGQEVGLAAVTLGEISVRTPYGPIASIGPGEAAPWRPGRPLAPPIPLAAAPAASQAELSGLRSMVLPGNTPVAVDVAARAAMAIASQSSQPAPAAGPAHAGYVHALSGLAFAQGPFGRAVAVSVGDTFDAGTTFSTGEEGRVVLKFADGQTVVLGTSSVVRVDQYRFDESNIGASRTGLDLLNGAMRFVGGVIEAENRAGVRVTAGASVVQILSTGPIDFTLVVDTRAQEVGVAVVTTGEISVRTPYGRIARIQANESAPWMPGRAPALPVPLAQAPTAVAGEIAALLATVVPGNTPVAVDAAARAAVALAAARDAEAAAAADHRNTQLQAAAQEALDRAAAAAKATSAAAEDLMARTLEALFRTVPATAVGPELAALPAAPGSPGPADPWILPLPSTTTPGGGRGCVGSPC